MRSADFWSWFDHAARPRLAGRADGFSRIFSHLDHLDRPATIIETGCLRRLDAWETDGQSTLLFDRYCAAHPGARLVSVDRDPAAIALCRSFAGPHACLLEGDSVAVLNGLGADPTVAGIDLLYLDTGDLQDPIAAAHGALNELLAAAPLLAADTLVVVDDAPPVAEPVLGNAAAAVPGGSARLIGDYAARIGRSPVFTGYQFGWVGFGRRGSLPAQAAPAAVAPAAARRAVNMTEMVQRMTDALPRSDRLSLGLRLIAPAATEITFQRDGVRWTGFPWDEMISVQLFLDGGFQEVELRRVMSWLRRYGRVAPPRDVIVDLGANIGTTTIPFARWTDCHIVAVEPVPEVLALLRRNVADNGLAARVTCVAAAIGSGGGTVRLALPAANSGGGEVIISDQELSFARSHATRGTAEARQIGLAALLQREEIAPERVALVWSDTQGCEADVIDSGRALWEAGVPLFAECDPRVSGPTRMAALLAAARQCFTHFIPADDLKASIDAGRRPIADLPAFVAGVGPFGTDLLLLPSGLDPAGRQ